MLRGSRRIAQPPASVKLGAMSFAILLAVAVAAAPPPPIDPRVQARIDRILKATPLIDGHNDIAELLRENYGGRTEKLASGTEAWQPKPLMTDMARLRAGRVGGQFWSVFIPADVQGDRAIRDTLEEIDIVKRMIAAYPHDLEQAFTADDVVRIHKAGKVASMIGVEGGHQMAHSFAALRQYYALGARYMTLTHFKTTDWADSATDVPQHDGLTAYGESVVREMNRIGMLVDLSHVSEATMMDALDTSKAPVIFSHSSAKAIDGHPRNVSDAVLARVARNGGVVMVNFAPDYVNEAIWKWSADRDAEKARIVRLNTGHAAGGHRRRPRHLAGGASRAGGDRRAGRRPYRSYRPVSPATTMSGSAATSTAFPTRPPG